jgi:MoaA/NifB/PqqE/SkfB family radical SAM enzyme
MTITKRIDEITQIPLSHRHEFIPAPKSCKIETGTRCNYNCSFCVRSIRENDTDDMDRALFSRIIRELRAAGVEELGLFYINEPFVSKWLPEAIAEAKEVGFPYTFVTTNGSALTAARVEACFAAGLNSLKFSINFSDAKQLSDVAQVSEHFWRKAIENLKMARRIRDEGGYGTKIYASSIQFDGEQGKKMEAVVKEIRPFVDEFYFLPLYGMSGATKAAGWKPQPGNPGRLDAMRDPLPCWACFTEAHITADGFLAACCFGSGLDGGLIMADLKEKSFMEGWNSEEFRKLRRAHLFKDVSGTACAECAAG